VVASPVTGRVIRVRHCSPREGNDALALGRLAAQMLLDAGAGSLLASDAAGAA
jgi:hypothetical protein